MVSQYRAEDSTEQTGEMSPPAVTRPVEDRDLGLDQVFEILKNQRRRYVLWYLRERDEQVSLSDLAEQIAAWENDKPVKQITSSERKRVYVGLYQCHLPKMDGMDVVEFNKPRATIEPDENIDVFYSYLYAPEDNDDGAWSKYYAGLAVVTVLALPIAIAVESTVALPVVGAVTGLALAAFATMALVHHASQRRDEDEGVAGMSVLATEPQ